MNKKIDLIRTLFKAREDVFAIQWQKKNKSGYMPAYFYDPYRYKLHRMKGGTFKNYNDKTLLPLTDHEINRHLSGEQLIGVYPLLKNNTSWFIAADFDRQNWAKECQSFISACSDKSIPAYLERSRSGNGGHVWIFFDRPYAAVRSRKIIISILQESGIFSVFDKSSSFDRLFPNQDFLSGKGLGNLIALPFYKPALDEKNSCFVDKNLEAHKNQWSFLSSIRKVSTDHLDTIFTSLTNDNFNNSSIVNLNKLQIILSSVVLLNRSGMSSKLINFLKEELNFANPEYFIKKKSRRSTWKSMRYFNYIEELENRVKIPRGFVGKLLRYCTQEKIDFEFIDKRKKLPQTSFSSNLELRKHQKIAIAAVAKKDFGVIAAPPGSGKTIIGLKIVAEKEQPALIIVHRKQ